MFTSLFAFYLCGITEENIELSLHRFEFNFLSYLEIS